MIKTITSYFIIISFTFLLILGAWYLALIVGQYYSGASYYQLLIIVVCGVSLEYFLINGGTKASKKKNRVVKEDGV